MTPRFDHPIERVRIKLTYYSIREIRPASERFRGHPYGPGPAAQPASVAVSRLGRDRAEEPRRRRGAGTRPAGAEQGCARVPGRRLGGDEAPGLVAVAAEA